MARSPTNLEIEMLKEEIQILKLKYEAIREVLRDIIFETQVAKIKEEK